MIERWHQLPLDHALSCAPAVRALVQALAAESSGAESSGAESSTAESSTAENSAATSCGGDPGAASVVPYLGPAVLMDQLTVMVHDRCAGASTEQAGRLVPRLARLRKALTAHGRDERDGVGPAWPIS